MKFTDSENSFSHTRNSWLNRKTTPEDRHLEDYWKTTNHPNRVKLADLVRSEAKSSNITILEYGSHVGANIAAIQNQISIPNSQIFCVEPNQEAASFLIEQFPGAEVLVGEDQVFLRTGFPNRNINISIINAVFYCIDEKRAKRVLKRIYEMSEIVIIGDELENMNGTKSIQTKSPYSILHPYASWLHEFGCKQIYTVAAPIPKVAIKGFIIARNYLRSFFILLSDLAIIDFLEFL